MFTRNTACLRLRNRKASSVPNPFGPQLWNRVSDRTRFVGLWRWFIEIPHRTALKVPGKDSINVTSDDYEGDCEWKEVADTIYLFRILKRLLAQGHLAATLGSWLIFLSTSGDNQEAGLPCYGFVTIRTLPFRCLTRTQTFYFAFMKFLLSVEIFLWLGCNRGVLWLRELSLGPSDVTSEGLHLPTLGCGPLQGSSAVSYLSVQFPVNACSSLRSTHASCRDFYTQACGCWNILAVLSLNIYTIKRVPWSLCNLVGMCQLGKKKAFRKYFPTIKAMDT